MCFDQLRLTLSRVSVTVRESAGTDHYTNLEEEHVSHDIVIRNGVIADGTGEELFEGDIAIDGETITQLGNVKAKGDE